APDSRRPERCRGRGSPDRDQTGVASLVPHRHGMPAASISPGADDNHDPRGMVGLEPVDSLDRDSLACLLDEQRAAGVVRRIGVTGIPGCGKAFRYLTTALGEIGSEQAAEPVVESA